VNSKIRVLVLVTVSVFIVSSLLPQLSALTHQGFRILEGSRENMNRGNVSSLDASSQNNAEPGQEGTSAGGPASGSATTGKPSAGEVKVLPADPGQLGGTSERGQKAQNNGGPGNGEFLQLRQIPSFLNRSYIQPIVPYNGQ
jgi:hypothetical protein